MVHTLTATDIASGWVEFRFLLNNAHTWTFKAMTNIKNTTPFPIREFHLDNSGTYINNTTEIWGKKRVSPSPVAMTTRSMTPVCKPSIPVKQKNGADMSATTGS
jgi:hypothetical protein